MGTVDGERVACSQLPARSLYEYKFDVADNTWVAWKTLVSEYTPPADGMFSKIIVPTVDTVRSTFLVDIIAKTGKPCLFVGESGTAKSVTIQAYLNGLDGTQSVVLNMNFSSRTSSTDVQRAIEDSVEKRTKDTYGPPLGKRLLIFLDDMNMPRVDTYGTQQPIALLKLFITMQGLYDRGKDLNWKNMKDIQIIGAMGPPGGARNPVDPRFISLFSVFEIQFPSDENLSTIYQNILVRHLAKLPDSIRSAVSETLTDVTLKLYNHIVEKLPPTPSRFHYIFNLRDLSRIYEGLLLSVEDHFPGPGEFLRLWRNECLRVFHDRLICEEDKDVVQSKIKSLVQDNFAASAEVVNADPILFGDYRYALKEGEARLYQVRRVFFHIPPLFLFPFLLLLLLSLLLLLLPFVDPLLCIWFLESRETANGLFPRTSRTSQPSRTFSRRSSRSSTSVRSR
jgi:dynein heavy chain